MKTLLLTIAILTSFAAFSSNASTQLSREICKEPPAGFYQDSGSQDGGIPREPFREPTILISGSQI